MDVREGVLNALTAATQSSYNVHYHYEDIATLIIQYYHSMFHILVSDKNNPYGRCYIVDGPAEHACDLVIKHIINEYTDIGEL